MTGGTLALVIAAAALAGGVGGLFSAILAKRLGEHHAQHLQEQLDREGLLLGVRTSAYALSGAVTSSTGAASVTSALGSAA